MSTGDVRAAIACPGHAKADVGEAEVVIAGVRPRAHDFAMDLPHSDVCFVATHPAATTEAWLDGHNRAFAFFGGVPMSILYDNDNCLLRRILPDGTPGNEVIQLRATTASVTRFVMHCHKETSIFYQ